MMKRIVVANEKGGVGKTTTAVNLAYGLSNLLGHTVLLIDLDPHASATMSLGLSPDSGSHDLLMKQGNLEDVAVRARSNLDLVPSNPRLTLAQIYLQGMDSDRGGLRGFFSGREARSRLKDVLGSSVNNYDFVIVDCAPVLDIITLNALAFGDEVLVPISLDFLSEVGTKPFLNSVSELRSLGGSAQLRYIVPTFYRRLRRSKEVLGRLKKYYRNLVTEPIRDNTHVAEAPQRGLSIFEYKPNSSGSKDYASLARRVAYGN